MTKISEGGWRWWLHNNWTSLAPLNGTLKMVRMVTFTLCIFYHIKKKKEPGGEKKASRQAEMVERSLGSSLSGWTPLPWDSNGLPTADDLHSRHPCSWLVPGHSRFKFIPMPGTQLRKHFFLLSFVGCYPKWLVWVSGKVFLDMGCHPTLGTSVQMFVQYY